MDAKIDLGALTTGLTTKNYKDRTPHIVLGLQRAVKGKLAQDADIEDVAEVVEALADILPPDEVEEVKEVLEGDEPAKDDDDAQLRAMLKAKGISDEEIDRICGSSGDAPAMDDKNGDKDKDKPAMDAALIQTRIREATKGMVSKVAMDAEIAKVRKTLSDIEDARRTVRPYVGELEMAFDSAPDVVRQALTMLGKSHAGKHDDALIDILSTCEKPGDKPKAQPRIAMDAAAAKGFDERFGTSRIGHAA
jgi:hypothetical protein